MNYGGTFGYVLCVTVYYINFVSCIHVSFCRGQIAGHLVRVQVYRDVGRHQSQCGRAAGRTAVPDSAEAGESGEVAVSGAQLILVFL